PTSWPARCGTSMKVSKNQDTCARCHLVGLQSGMDWAVWSSGPRGCARVSVCARMSANRARKVSRSKRGCGCPARNSLICWPPERDTHSINRRRREKFAARGKLGPRKSPPNGGLSGRRGGRLLARLLGDAQIGLQRLPTLREFLLRRLVGNRRDDNDVLALLPIDGRCHGISVGQLQRVDRAQDLIEIA